MSKQSLNLDKDWQEVKNSFINHFQEDNLIIGEHEIKYTSNGESLEINKDGRVKGEMPLHSVEINDAKTILFNENEVKISTPDSTYKYRR